VASGGTEKKNCSESFLNMMKSSDEIEEKLEYAVCNTCTIKLVEICFARAWWFRLIREPLRFGMVIMGMFYDIDPKDFPVKSESCNGCVRFTKTSLKDKSSLFRFLNGIINPIFDGIMETIVSKEEILEAKQYAREVTHVASNQTGND
jgi:hypothetical protein